ncbi:MAG: serine/threonine-protein kinase [Planctomycetota bacterium]
MDRSGFARLQELFNRLSDAPPTARKAALETLRREDVELAAILEQMVASDGGPADQQLDALHRQLELVAVDAIAGDAIPEHIAEFKIVATLGRGGMGIVYRAEQQSPLRAVALKVLQPGMTSVHSLRRFELEAQVLGRLQHSGIAQIYAAGTAPVNGTIMPYFAMELIDGTPLTRFANDRHLTLHARIELLIQVADAVHHAHQKGVVHRDLKPANILVTADGQPKILDFGVARLIDPVLAGSFVTQTGQVIGTLPYMSPEQVSGAADAVDTRSDVYALGVLAYELLSGQLPIEVSHKSLPEAARLIADHDPPRLGTVMRSLRGDLETIAAKALNKDPARRYASAHELALDFTRYLREEPIEARPPSTMYQVNKFARRHRGLVAGLTAAVVIMALGVAGMCVVTMQAKSNERVAKAVASFVEGILTAPDPWLIGVPGHKNMRVEEVLARANDHVDRALADLPAVEAGVRATLGRTFSNLGRYDRALPHLRRAHTLAVSSLGANDPDTLRCQSDLALAHLRLGNRVEAERVARDAVARLGSTAGDADRATFETTSVLINVLRERGQFDEALELARRSYVSVERACGPDHPQTLSALHNYAVMQFACGALDDAEAKLRVVLERRRRQLGDEHPFTLATLGSLGEVLWQRGQFADALVITRQQLAAYQRVLDHEHPQVLRSQHGLGVLLADAGELDEALALRDRLLEVAPRVLGDDHPLTLQIRLGRADVLRRMRRMKEAEDDVRVLIKTARETATDDLPDLLNMLGCILDDSDRAADARPYLEEALDIVVERGSPKHWSTAVYRANLGNCLRLLGEYDQAEAELLESYELLEAQLGIANDRTQYALGKLVLLYEKTNQRDKWHEFKRRLTPAGQQHARGQ